MLYSFVCLILSLWLSVCFIYFLFNFLVGIFFLLFVYSFNHSVGMYIYSFICLLIHFLVYSYFFSRFILFYSFTLLFVYLFEVKLFLSVCLPLFLIVCSVAPSSLMLVVTVTWDVHVRQGFERIT